MLDMSDMALTFLLLGGTIFLFLIDRFRLDVVAMLSLLTLMLTGLVTTEEALAGFADPIVVIIAGLFVVGSGIYQTGVANEMGTLLGRVAGRSESRILVYLMLLVAFLSAFMSSTGAVAILLPVAATLASRAKVSPAKLFMPLALGSLIGGMITLIGTPPNLVVALHLSSIGMQPFGFTAFTPIGLIILGIAIVYMLLFGRHLLSDRSPKRPGLAGGDESEEPTLADLSSTYSLGENMFRLRIRTGSPLAGLTLATSGIGSDFKVDVLEIQSWPDDVSHPLPMRPITADTILETHDILHVKGTAQNVARLRREMNLGIRPKGEQDTGLISRELGMAEVVVRNRSDLVGKTLRELNFRNSYHLNVLALMRRGQPITRNVANTPLRFGDTLLVEGRWVDIESLMQDRSYLIVLDLPKEMREQLHTPRNAMVAVTIVVLMLGLMTFKVVPTVMAVLLAAMAMILTGCIRTEDIYRSINWQTVILIAAMLPMATALEKSGGVEFAATLLVDSFGPYGPAAIMVGLFIITAFFSQFISNTATAVILAPIASATAFSLDLSPYPLLMMVAISASTAFSTPISSPVNTLVMVPGGYRFIDYAKVGIPLQLLTLLAALLTIPLFFPY